DGLQDCRIDTRVGQQRPIADQYRSPANDGSPGLGGHRLEGGSDGYLNAPVASAVEYRPGHWVLAVRLPGGDQRQQVLFTKLPGRPDVGERWRADRDCACLV